MFKPHRHFPPTAAKVGGARFPHPHLLLHGESTRFNLNSVTISKITLSPVLLPRPDIWLVSTDQSRTWRTFFYNEMKIKKCSFLFLSVQSLPSMYGFIIYLFCLGVCWRGGVQTWEKACPSGHWPQKFWWIAAICGNFKFSRNVAAEGFELF